VKVLLRTALSPLSGYGRDGIGLARALHQLGHDVRIQPEVIEVPLPPDVAMLLTLDNRDSFDIQLHHVELAHLGMRPADQGRARHNIAWAMWDFEGLDDANADLPQRLASGYDKVLVYDTLSEQTISQATDLPVRVLQGGYDSQLWKHVKRDWFSGPFVYGIAGRLSPRKNPLVLIKAFRQLKEEHGADFDARLIINDTMVNLPWDVEAMAPGIRYITEPWTDKQMQKFYATIHCYVGPSWGEGKNLPALEAATTGAYAILSDVPGHAWSFPGMFSTKVGGTRRPIVPGMVGLDVDQGELADAMWAAYVNRAETARKADQLANTLPPSMDWQAVVHRLIALLGL
jgi:glycosyltransferase involved in cell wall biosynthesis